MALPKIWSIFIIFILLCGCATPYKQDDWLGGLMGGFSNKYINNNTVIVSFHGNNFTPIQKAQSYVMYRAAEITINSGYDYFIVTNANDLPQPKDEAHTAVIVVKMFKGNVPSNLPHAYDAKATIAHLGPLT